MIVAAMEVIAIKFLAVLSNLEATLL